VKYLSIISSKLEMRGARRLRGQGAWRAIKEYNHRTQGSVIGLVTKIYYFKLLRASEETLSRWYRLYLQSLAPAPVSRTVGQDKDDNQAANRKNNCRYHNTMKNMLYQSHLVG
jgi:hypothetical protein